MSFNGGNEVDEPWVEIADMFSRPTWLKPRCGFAVRGWGDFSF